VRDLLNEAMEGSLGFFNLVWWQSEGCSSFRGPKKTLIEQNNPEAATRYYIAAFIVIH